MKSCTKVLSTFVIITLLITIFVSMQTPSYLFSPLVIQGNAGANDASEWHNTSWLNVTVESKRPRILWYDFQKCTNSSFNGRNKTLINDNSQWSSRRNNMTETDNATWYRFIINISSDQGWDNIEYINISGWHDNGNDTDVDGSLTGVGGYNRSGNHGGNRNFFLCYDNTSNTTGTYRMIYPSNGTEITIGNYTEHNVSDVLGISGQTETHNISFCFKPGYQFRYAPGPGESNTWTNDAVHNTNGNPTGDGYSATTCCWESFDNPWSWNFNITVENFGENWRGSVDSDGIDRYKSWVNDEFGIYSYTEIVSADNSAIFGAPGERHSTNGSSWYNTNFNSGESQNVTVCTRSNGNYSMTVNLSDLYHSAHISNPAGTGTVDPSGWSDPYALQINNSNIYVRGGNRSTSVNFTNTDTNCIWLYGYGNRSSGTPSLWQTHEVNGTCKYTGEATLSEGPAVKSEQFPNGYNYSTFGSLNSNSTTIEFACTIPATQIAGKYSTHVYYHLRTQTH